MHAQATPTSTYFSGRSYAVSKPAPATTGIPFALSDCSRSGIPASGRIHRDCASRVLGSGDRDDDEERAPLPADRAQNPRLPGPGPRRGQPTAQRMQVGYLQARGPSLRSGRAKHGYDHPADRAAGGNERIGPNPGRNSSRVRNRRDGTLHRPAQIGHNRGHRAVHGPSAASAEPGETHEIRPRALPETHTKHHRHARATTLPGECAGRAAARTQGSPGRQYGTICHPTQRDRRSASLILLSGSGAVSNHEGKKGYGRTP